MVVDSEPVARELRSPAKTPTAAASRPFTRARIRFRKQGDLRFLSHHDLMHCLERAFRRAGLAVLPTGGFNPRPRMVFALSLALGLVGQREVVEVDLADSLSVDDIRGRLEAHAPPGLEVVEVRLIGSKDRARVCQAVYRVAVPEERRAVLPERIAAVLAASHCWIQRSRPQPRRYDLRPYLIDLCLTGSHLEMVICVTPQGSARPDEVLQLLGLGHLLTAGSIIERTDLELEDEAPPDSERRAGVLNATRKRRQETPRVSATCQASSHADQENSKQTNITGPSDIEESGPGSNAETEPPQRPTPLFPGPMSFDS